MKIVIAPDSFKESLTAEEVAEDIKRGFQQSIADVECLLLSLIHIYHACKWSSADED